MLHKRLGEIGMEMGYLNENAVLRAVRRQEEMADRDRSLIGQILLEAGDIGEIELQRMLQRQSRSDEEDWN
ncbi:MAG: hypothetical protein NTU59_00200 [Coprothermobacterota bacterium]|nr:hypothetical protein [Coprothermobacterota bacterium]